MLMRILFSLLRIVDVDANETHHPLRFGASKEELAGELQVGILPGCLGISSPSEFTELRQGVAVTLLASQCLLA